MIIPQFDPARANAPHRDRILQATAALIGQGPVPATDPVTGFERAFAEFCGTAHAIGTNSRQDAIRLILEALEIGPGDHVILPAFGPIDPWFAISALGARPIPVDVGPDGLIDPALIPAAITSRTRAIIPVHLWGRLADMPAILDIARNTRIAVIEDASEAPGAQRKGRRAGAFGLAAAFGFPPNANLAALGDAGLVTTHDPALAATITQLANQGRPHPNRPQLNRHDRIGHLTRLDPIQAAILHAKLPGLDTANAARRRIAHAYRTALAETPGLRCPAPAGPDMVWNQFVIRTPDRAALRAHLADHGIGTAIHHPVTPMDQPCYTPLCAAGLIDPTRLPMARHLAETVLSLPIAEYLAPPETDHVIAALRHRNRPPPPPPPLRPSQPVRGQPAIPGPVPA